MTIWVRMSVPLVHLLRGDLWDAMSMSSINWVLIGPSLRGVVHLWILSRRSLAQDLLRVVLMSELSHCGLTLIHDSLRPDSLSRVPFP